MNLAQSLKSMSQIKIEFVKTALLFADVYRFFVLVKRLFKERNEFVPQFRAEPRQLNQILSQGKRSIWDVSLKRVFVLFEVGKL